MKHAHFDKFIGTNKYIASQSLRNAVNVSIALQRPLLVKGEPG
ncbi:MAG TPA: MoxR family ATPase, partial [Thermodesulfobacteriota bacterium]|nr:MoxR family ATPase [Thermodesulfobacteriota bacterium]